MACFGKQEESYSWCRLAQLKRRWQPARQVRSRNFRWRWTLHDYTRPRHMPIGRRDRHGRAFTLYLRDFHTIPQASIPHDAVLARWLGTIIRLPPFLDNATPPCNIARFDGGATERSGARRASRCPRAWFIGQPPYLGNLSLFVFISTLYRAWFLYCHWLCGRVERARAFCRYLWPHDIEYSRRPYATARARAALYQRFPRAKSYRDAKMMSFDYPRVLTAYWPADGNAVGELFTDDDATRPHAQLYTRHQAELKPLKWYGQRREDTESFRFMFMTMRQGNTDLRYDDSQAAAERRAVRNPDIWHWHTLSSVNRQFEFIAEFIGWVRCLKRRYFEGRIIISKMTLTFWHTWASKIYRASRGELPDMRRDVNWFALREKEHTAIAPKMPVLTTRAHVVLRCLLPLPRYPIIHYLFCRAYYGR